MLSVRSSWARWCSANRVHRGSWCTPVPRDRGQVVPVGLLKVDQRPGRVGEGCRHFGDREPLRLPFPLLYRCGYAPVDKYGTCARLTRCRTALPPPLRAGRAA